MPCGAQICHPIFYFKLFSPANLLNLISSRMPEKPRHNGVSIGKPLIKVPKVSVFGAICVNYFVTHLPSDSGPIHCDSR